MDRPSDAEGPRRSAARRGAAHTTFDWARFLKCQTPQDCLDELASKLGPSLVDLVLDSSEPSTGTLAEWRRPNPPQGTRKRHVLSVGGRPPWTLIVTGGATRPGPAARAEAVAALEAWRQSQLELARAESRLASRSRELDLIQTLGRRAAEARDPQALFAASVATLERGEELDLALAAHALDGSPAVTAFVTRPWPAELLARVAAVAARLLDWDATRPPAPRVLELETFDVRRGPRTAVAEDDLVVLPLLRRGAVAAGLVVVPTHAAGEGGLRLLYSAANQLSLQLERIVTVREAEADRFRAILDSMPQAVALTDGELRVRQLNRAAREIFAELSLPCDGRLDDHGVAGLGDLLRRAREAPEGVVEGELRSSADRLFSVTLSRATPNAGAGGFVLVCADITESRKMQQRLAQADKMASLGQMISGVAHELNNPLASILGYAQLLRLQSGDSPLAEKLGVLKREAERCQRIVRNLLSFARAREPERRAVALNDVVRSVVGLMQYALKVDDVRVATDLSADLPALHGDAHELQQVLVNLVTNAQHAIRQRGGGGTIELRTRVTPGGALRLEVEDDGPGVPEAIRSRIFDPFFTTKREGQGTGLGLALCYRVVQAHGGTIELGAAKPGGACFRVTLPAADRHASSQEPQPAAVRVPLRPGRILVVDDEPTLARMVCEALEQDGHRACAAGDGREALARLDTAEFDLILSDVRMPGMGGERLWEEIGRRHPRLARRMLLATGDTVGDESERFARRSGLPLLHKPFDLDDLRGLVRQRLAEIDPS